MKLFGRKVFDFKKEVEPQEMYDFAQHGLLGGSMIRRLEDYIELDSTLDDLRRATSGKKPKKKKAPKKKAKQYTPKQLFELNALNDNEFKIVVDEEYLDEQISDLKAKLSLFTDKRRKFAALENGVRFGELEVKSMIERLENRRRITEVSDVVNEYAHTTTRHINSLLKEQDYLRAKTADEFIPDFPNDAIQAMKKYNKMCEKLTNKTTHFYVIAKKEDFEKKDQKRDPILLAQSPFGFFWQVLGAWDEEMVFLGDL